METREISPEELVVFATLQAEIDAKHADVFAASAEDFAYAVESAMDADQRIRDYLSSAVDYRNHSTFLTYDGKSGFAISPEGDLQSVFSLVKGRGNALVSRALLEGAITLDCFDGYLPAFYAAHGFVEVKREANWTAGGPDVIYMAIGE